MLHNVKLVFFGENEAEYGNPIVDNNEPVRDWNYFAAEDPSNIYLGGVSINDLKKEFWIK